MPKDIILNHKDIKDPQKITKVTCDAFERNDLNIHTDEVEDIDDDFSTGHRRLRVKTAKFFNIGNVPWHNKNNNKEEL
jgi:hypothetical protein